MTFLSTWRLVLLAAPLALLVAYVVAQRMRARTAARFTSVDLLASVAPNRSGWQRHVPAGALLVALVLLVTGFAQPALVTRQARQRATVMLAIDTSGSMVAADVAPTRLAAAKTAAHAFVAGLPRGIQLGLVSFSDTAHLLVSPTTRREAVLAAVDGLQADGPTATAAAIELSLDAIRSTPVGTDGKTPPAAIVLMSDGTPTVGTSDGSPVDAVDAAAAAAKQAGVAISTIAFGTDAGTVVVQGETVPVPSDPAAMARIADASGGRTFTAETADQLDQVYAKIGRAVGYDTERREITAWFTGLALLAATAAAVAALVWTQRIL